ncbi:C10 family peptidase [Streptococcus didelphis]|uniref:Streptopain n=1 Tax=Streptococcus didelphis TaxID=102886 RepID=A0ABY9LI83_9STRE|nr:C10 family peptidase [Streptococcus didelphis]WMB27821.1 C10 family peptidase [Streptococcus didelphis]WMB29716.1 C10 family peptidase [Streptococcus didelphis]
MNKKKLGIRLLSLLALGGFILSNPVFADQNFSRNEKEAKDTAITFIEKTSGLNDSIKLGSERNAQDIKLNKVSLGDQTTESNMYIYNISTGGFIIVSADTRSPEILGYSPKGTFDAEGKENISSFIKNYADEIKENKKISVTYNNSDNIKQPAVRSLLDAKGIHYNQGYPYNLLTPVIEKVKAGEKSHVGQHAATGCVATATAQIMKYHNYPNKGVKDHAYTMTNEYFNNPLNLWAAISTREYNWNNILPAYSGRESEAQKDAISGLMADVGISVEMNYGPSSGSAGSPFVQKALKENFGYSQTVRQITRSDFSKEDWEGQIDNELQQNQPVYYQGVGQAGGHAFVIDGSDGRGFYHVNWGWGGSSDGFFRLEALNPAALGTGGGAGGFNNYQSAVIGIKP